MEMIDDFFDYWCDTADDEEIELHKQLLKIDLDLDILHTKRKLITEKIENLHLERLEINRRYFS